MPLKETEKQYHEYRTYSTATTTTATAHTETSEVRIASCEYSHMDLSIALKYRLSNLSRSILILHYYKSTCALEKVRKYK